MVKSKIVTEPDNNLTFADRNVTNIPKICLHCKKTADVIVDDSYYLCATCELKRLKIRIK